MSRRTHLGIGLIVTSLCGTAAWLHVRSTRYDEIIAQAASRHRIDFYLAKAIIYEESWFRPGIRGAAGELGLMQITMGAATDYYTRNSYPAIRPERVLEPQLNVEIGCWYLSQSVDRYRDSPDPTMFALLRYNAGEIRADAWLKSAMAGPVPAGKSPEEFYLSLVDFPKTREYVRRILARARSRNYWF